MKAVRILQVVALLLLLTYFVLLHSANPTLLDLPFLIPLPPSVVLAFAIVVGWLIGWVPGRIAAWRKAREVARLQSRLSELEQHMPSYDKGPVHTTPVIPDRMPDYEDHRTSRQGE